jgi:hypothetical protein
MADLEDVKEAIKAALLGERFKEILQEHYAQKSAMYGDNLVCHLPNEVHTHPRWDPQEMFPYGELNSPISRNLYPDSFVERLGHEIQIFWHIRHDDEIELDKHVLRYIRATRLYFQENLYLADLGNEPITLNDDSYSPFVPANIYSARPFVKSGMLIIYVNTIN